jgi:hypothetical protein
MENKTEVKDGATKEKDPNILFELTDAVKKKARDENPGIPLDVIESELDDDRMFYCIVRKPTNGSVTRYVQKIAQASRDNKDTSQIHKQFVYDSLVHPTKEQFMDACEKLPLLPTTVAGELGKGQGFGVNSKKKSL